jgi:pimeloyl-ACP methyl ester carboxylesterase
MFVVVLVAFIIKNDFVKGSNEMILHKTGTGLDQILLISGLGDGKESYNWNLADTEVKNKLNLHQTTSLQDSITEKFPNFSIVSFDQPGFGENKHIPIPKTFNEYTDLIGIVPKIVIGHSIGGRLAQYIACKYNIPAILLDPTPDYLLDTAKSYNKHLENPKYLITSQYMEMVANSLPDIKSIEWSNMVIVYDNTSEKDTQKINFYKSTKANTIEVKNASHWVHVSHPEIVILELSKLLTN